MFKPKSEAEKVRSWGVEHKGDALDIAIKKELETLTPRIQRWLESPTAESSRTGEVQLNHLILELRPWSPYELGYELEAALIVRIRNGLRDAGYTVKSNSEGFDALTL